MDTKLNMTELLTINNLLNEKITELEITKCRLEHKPDYDSMINYTHVITKIDKLNNISDKIDKLIAEL